MTTDINTWPIGVLRTALLEHARRLLADPRSRINLDASDLVQATFERISAVQPPENLGSMPQQLGYLRKIQENLYTDEWRKQQTLKRGEGDSPVDEQQLRNALNDSALGLEDVAISASTLPEDRADQRDKEQRIHLAIERLPESQRAVMKLRMQNMEFEDIAETLKMTAGQVAGLYRRGLAALQDEIGSE